MVLWTQKRWYVPYWHFVTLLTQLANCHLQKWFLVSAFVKAFLVSPRKYQPTIIYILPVAERNHGTSKNNPWKNNTFDQQKTWKQCVCPLDPLQVGDDVFIRSGVVVKTREFDQYFVKVFGSDRFTLRNQQFLRKFEPHQSYSNQKSHLWGQHLFADFQVLPFHQLLTVLLLRLNLPWN